MGAPSAEAASAEPQLKKARLDETPGEPKDGGADDFCYFSVLGVNQQEGLSVVHCSGESSEAHVHISSDVASTEALSAGDTAAFRFRVDAEGTTHAFAPVWKLCGRKHEASQQPLQLGQFVGELKELSPDGAGFIDCAEITAMYQQDARIGALILSASDLEIRNSVSFNVQVNASGVPLVKHPCWKCCSDPSTIVKPKPPSDGMTAVKLATPKRPSAEPPTHLLAPKKEAASAQGPVLFGKIKLVNCMKGYSFIECADVDHDVFLHQSAANPNDMTKGDVVGFQLKPVGQGKPQAAHCWKLLSTGQAVGDKTPDFPRYVGSITLLKSNCNGEVACDEVQEQQGKKPEVCASLMKSQGLKVGDTIAFDINIGVGDRPEISSATCWKLCEGIDAAPRQWAAPSAGSLAVPKAAGVVETPPDMVVGNVARIYHSKGISFVACHGYPKDVFVHGTIADPNLLELGMYVAFKVRYNAKQEPQADPPFYRLTGWLREGETPSFGQDEGEVKNLTQLGHGFVDCPRVEAEFGRKAMIHCKVMKTCELQVGDYIHFETRVGTQGFPQVNAPCWKCISPYSSWPAASSGPPAGIATPPPAVIAANAAAMAAPPPQRVPPIRAPSAPVGQLRPPSAAVTPASQLRTPAMLRQMAPKLAPTKKTAEQDELPLQYSVASLKLDEILFGSVSSVNAQVSTIDCPDSGAKDDVLVQRSMGESLQVDDLVAIQVKLSDGVAVAQAPVWRLAGIPAEDEPLEFGEHVGILRFLAPNGEGVVHCPDMQELHGREAVLSPTMVQQCALLVGDVFAFSVQVEPRTAVPYVQQPCWMCCSPAWPTAVALRKVLQKRKDAVASRGASRQEARMTGAYEENYVAD